MQDIELEIRITGLSASRFLATVARSPGGHSCSRPFEMPAEGLDVLAAAELLRLEPTREVRRRSAPREASRLSLLLSQGKALFDLVFEGDIYLAFRRAFDLSRESGQFFHLQLVFDHAAPAADWPWEALVLPDGNPLALQGDVSIERRIHSKRMASRRQLPSRREKLRVLVAGASPAALDPLDVKAEKTWIRRALGQVAEVQLLDRAQRQDLDQAFAGSAGFDLLHWIGHGDFEDGQGGLWLHGEAGAGERLSSQELPAFLRGSMPFVFLNVCHGGRLADEVKKGVAEALLRAGAGAVLAMRREITDRGAVALAKSFYQRIALGETLARALAAARREAKLDSGDWAVPVLYLAGEDFALVTATAPASAAPAPATPAESPPPAHHERRAAKEDRRSPRRAFWPLAVAGLVLSLALMVVGGSAWWRPSSPPAAEPTSAASKTAAAPPIELPAGAAEKPRPLPLLDTAAASPSPSPRSPDPRPELNQTGGAALPPPVIQTASQRRCPSPPGLDIEFVYIEAGQFLQGADHGDKGAQPRHQVTLTQPFCLGVYEITRGQWAAVMGEQVTAAEARLPKASVSWDEVQQFIRILNKIEPKAGYRLPTEAQWEYAARAGKTSAAGAAGNEDAQLSRFGNCKSGGANDGYDGPAPVGQFLPNAWGLYDMQGNVWEWVDDSWGYYGKEPLQDPRGLRTPADKRVRRGGAADSSVENCRLSARKGTEPFRHDQSWGFRLARNPAP